MRCVLPAPDWPWNSSRRAGVTAPCDPAIDASRLSNFARAGRCTASTSTGSARQMSSSQVIECSNAVAKFSTGGTLSTARCMLFLFLDFIDAVSELDPLERYSSTRTKCHTVFLKTVADA